MPFSERYSMWHSGNQPEGGFQLEPLDTCGPDASRTLAYVEVDDIEALLAQAVVLSGKIVKPKTFVSEEYGYYGLCTDPSGTLLGLWSMS
jgi:predicted enzyme related to lactoylglutathione lyase